MAVRTESYSTGGVRMPRPFKVRRLGHVGLNVDDVERCLVFYRDLLGFMVSDELDFSPRFRTDAEREKFGQRTAYFMRHGVEHHSFVIFPKPVINALAGYPPVTSNFSLNQIAWQVGNLREVSRGIEWFQQQEIGLLRVGRDQPGSNWHVYAFDPDRHANELFYGMEQIGWDRRSKSQEVYARLLEAPPAPIDPEYREIAEAEARGVDVASGYRFEEMGLPTYDVGGVRLPRPFKIVRVGPIRLFVHNIEQAVSFYRDSLGLSVTEEVHWRGQRCVFLRAGTEHHAIGLYPEPLRDILGVRATSSCLSVGLQIADYSQLRHAVRFLKERGAAVRFLPPELSPGIDYSAFVLDPEGQPLQLYYHMEQIGWDGRPRPAGERPRIDNDAWPDSIDAQPGVFTGETFLGPLA